MKKKSYISPALKIVHMETQQLIATSNIGVSSTETNTQLAPGTDGDDFANMLFF